MSMYSSGTRVPHSTGTPSNRSVASSVASMVSVNPQPSYQRYVGGGVAGPSSSRPLSTAESARARHFDPFKSLANDYRKLIMDTVAEHARALLEEQGLSDDLANDMRALWEVDCEKRSKIPTTAPGDDGDSSGVADENFAADFITDIEAAHSLNEDQNNKRRYSLSRTESDADSSLEPKRNRSANESPEHAHHRRHDKPEKDLMSEELDSDDDPSDEDGKFDGGEGNGSTDQEGRSSKSGSNAEMSLILGLYGKVVRNKHKVWRMELENCILQVKHGEEMLEVPMVDVKVDAEWK